MTVGPPGRAGFLAGAAIALALGVAPSPAAASGRPPHVTSLSVVRHWMHRTREVHDARTHFTRRGRRVSVPDGDGGSITAVVGGRAPTADGYGQLVFFFHGRVFLGWDTIRESIAIAPIHRGRGSRIVVPYVHYAPDDALCCPTRGRRVVIYRWTGRRIAPDGRPPNATGARVRLRAPAARWHACADVGPEQTDTAVYRIRALRIGCRRTRHMLRDWYYDRSAPDRGPRGWRCHVRRHGYAERHSCARGVKRIRFTLLLA
jgi:LppP/LprE lipoprotein